MTFEVFMNFMTIQQEKRLSSYIISSSKAPPGRVGALSSDMELESILAGIIQRQRPRKFRSAHREPLGKAEWWGKIPQQSLLHRLPLETT